MNTELTEEQVKEYCRKRNLVVVDSRVFNEMKARWSEPVKYGHWHWIYKEYGYPIAIAFYECSVCGAKHDMDWYYCPTCGAKMDEDKEGIK